MTMRRSHVDHDISESQLLELVSSNSVVHFVFSSLRVYLAFSLCVVLLTIIGLHRHVHLRPTMFLRVDAHSAVAQEQVPFSHTSDQGSGACCHVCGTREPPRVFWYVAGTWIGELAQRLQQLETQVGQQRAVIKHQQEQLMRQQTTIDADRAARTPGIPIAQDARVNLVDQSWKQAGDVCG